MKKYIGEMAGIAMIYIVAAIPFQNCMDGFTPWWFIRILLIAVGISLIQLANGKEL